MEQLTLEKVPGAIQVLTNKVDQLHADFVKRHLPQKDEDKWFDLNSLVNYLPGKPAKSTIYAKVGARAIPFYKNSLGLAFKKSEIDNWLEKGKVKTVEEISAEADENLSKNKNRN